ncbi:hypothetical protein BCR36DRAFT_316509 [Piromyces finnis]|uniref:SH3b domain-containing protein n=1 Tax=Piromyces finnis TaxID=1754191 RepID=A0A1Y1VNZ7_9FUNG|nr:hypothetical protein BCR36DRAFT_316509 [Piromyces finnis]|eukprot:ORX60100.1 hypothetical protein BCR36DRAFT_316509 [Piromyces finnis]
MNALKILLLILFNVIVTIAGAVYKVNVESKLNIRSKASTSSSIVGSLKNNDYIYVTSVSNGWAKFYKGYCSTQYLTKVTINPNYKTTTSLNFRTGPSTSYNAISTLVSGTVVTYYGRDPFNSSWGVTGNGYCSMTYLIPKGSSTIIPSTQNSGRIELTTQLLKQYDYPNEYAPGCTIKKYGCCITSITMALNRIQNKLNTPYDIAKKMAFSNCGAYHSSFNDLGFKIVNSPSLQIVLNSLRAGRIVPYGAINTSGNQHWVAVYGYTGDYKTLKSSDFLIYDPAYSRTKLSEHLNAFSISYMALIYN